MRKQEGGPTVSCRGTPCPAGDTGFAWWRWWAMTALSLMGAFGAFALLSGLPMFLFVMRAKLVK